MTVLPKRYRIEFTCTFCNQHIKNSLRKLRAFFHQHKKLFEGQVEKGSEKVKDEGGGEEGTRNK